MHTLVICEEAQVAELVTMALRQVGLRAVVRRTAPADATQLNDVSVILLDADDVETAIRSLQHLRDLTPTPILLASPGVADTSLLNYYRSGATAVIVKPYDLRLLAAQAIALTRLVVISGISPALHPLIDPDTQAVSLPHGEFRLTTLEYRLVAALLSRPGRVFTPEKLVEQVWGYSGEGDRSLVKGLVNRVRRKIEPVPQEPKYLVTESGVGYRFYPPQVNGAGPDEEAAENRAGRASE